MNGTCRHIQERISRPLTLDSQTENSQRSPSPQTQITLSSLDSDFQMHPYMRPKGTEYLQDNSHFFSECYETPTGLQGSSPPPDSSSPFLQISPPSEHSPPPYFSSAQPVTIHRDSNFGFDKTSDDNSDSPDSFTSTSDGMCSVKSSQTSDSSYSSSVTSSTSPIYTHEITSPSTTYELNDKFIGQLHQRLLVIAQERESQTFKQEQEYTLQCIVCDGPYPSFPQDIFSTSGNSLDPIPSRGANKTRIPPRWTSPPKSNDNNQISENDNPQEASSRSITRFPAYQRTNYDSVNYPLELCSLADDRYDLLTDDELGTLVFASPTTDIHSVRSLRQPRAAPLEMTFDHLRKYRHQTGHRRSYLTSESPLTPRTTKPPAPTYRVIKRAESYLAAQEVQHNQTADPEEPPNKKQRTATSNDAYRMRCSFVKKPASLRRAASLRSNPETHYEACVRTPSTAYAPTIPNTPRDRVSNVVRPLSNLPYPVPIIAPPQDHTARLPLSEEARAKIRLERLVERESRMRQQDGLLVDIVQRMADKHQQIEDEYEVNSPEDTDDECIAQNYRKIWENTLGIGESLRCDILDWILNTLPVDPVMQTVSSPSSYSCSSSTVTSSPCTTVSSCNSSFSASSTTHYSTTSNLFDQLSTSPETRFHAAYMFLRYFYLVLGDSDTPTVTPPRSQSKSRGLNYSQDGVELVTWDIAVGCLALGVKYHRDFLDPLLPVYAYEFQILSPHDITYEDLESSQRDILSALSYSLGITPQAIIDELWLALPSLRQLFDYSGGWNCVKKETWWRLFEAILEPDILRFPVSLLTTATLTDAITASLVIKYEYEAEWYNEISRRRRPRRLAKHAAKDESKLFYRRKRKAEKEAEGVVQDIQAVLRISDVKLHECRYWLSKLD